MKRLLVRGGAFCALLILLLYVVSLPFRIEEYRSAETYAELYASAPDTCDAVLIGGSNAYAYWGPTFAWRDRGISVFDLGISALPTPAIRYVVEEARKTQPDALYVITANSFKFPTTERDKRFRTKIHYVTDYLHLSPTKVAAVNALCDVRDYGFWRRLRFFFPVLEHHAQWSTLTMRAFVPSYDHVKGAATYRSFTSVTQDVTELFSLTDERTELIPEFERSVRDLCAYLKENEVRVLFVRLPQALEDEEREGEVNAVCDLLEGEGFELLDLSRSMGEIGLDPTMDFFDGKHTNMHGALKFTDYLGRFLQQRYGFADKRGQDAYADWDDAAERYDAFARLYVLDFELAHAARDTALAAPLVRVALEDSKPQVSWTRVEGAQAYRVYRRRALPAIEANVRRDDLQDFAWECVAEADSGQMSFIDAQCEPGVTYRYTVVAVSGAGSSLRYGRFDAAGAEVLVGGDAS